MLTFIALFVSRSIGMTSPDPSEDYTAAMAGLRATLEKRLKENADPPPLPVSRVAYDWRRLGLALREAIADSGLSLRALGGAIGVTSTDLSRLTSGTNVSIEKVFAACDWAGIDPRAFYQTPIKSTRCTSAHVKQSSASRAEGAPAGRGTSRDARSGLRATPGRKEP